MQVLLIIVLHHVVHCAIFHIGRRVEVLGDLLRVNVEPTIIETLLGLFVRFTLPISVCFRLGVENLCLEARGDVRLQNIALIQNLYFCRVWAQPLPIGRIEVALKEGVATCIIRIREEVCAILGWVYIKIAFVALKMKEDYSQILIGLLLRERIALHSDSQTRIVRAYFVAICVCRGGKVNAL